MAGQAQVAAPALVAAVALVAGVTLRLRGAVWLGVGGGKAWHLGISGGHTWRGLLCQLAQLH